MPDETYTTKVYFEGGSRTGGDKFIAASGGEITLESGAALSMISCAVLGLAGADLAVDDARRILASEFAGTVVIEPEPAAIDLAVSNLPKNVRHVRFYGSDTTQSASFWLTSVSAGREVFLYLHGDSIGTFTNASTQIDFSHSGCLILGSVGADISGFEMHTSLASDCMVHLLAIADNIWAIVATKGNVVE